MAEPEAAERFDVAGGGEERSGVSEFDVCEFAAFVERCVQFR